MYDQSIVYWEQEEINNSKKKLFKLKKNNFTHFKVLQKKLL